MTPMPEPSIDVAAAQEAAKRWLDAEGCGCCARYEKLEAAQRALAAAIGLVAYENYAGEIKFCQPGEEPTDA